MEDQVTVRLPRELGEALRAASRRLDRKSSEVVRMALRAYLQTERIAEAPADRVRGLLGILESNEPDLAERHREMVLESLQRGD